MAQISRESEGVKYTGGCEPNGFFLPGMMFCLSCGSQVHPYATDWYGLECSGCNRRIKSFATDDQMNDYLSQEWTKLQKMCEAKAIR